MFIAGQIDYSHRHFRNEKGTELKFARNCFWDHYEALAGRQQAKLGFI